MRVCVGAYKCTHTVWQTHVHTFHSGIALINIWSSRNYQSQSTGWGHKMKRTESAPKLSATGKTADKHHYGKVSWLPYQRGLHRNPNGGRKTVVEPRGCEEFLEARQEWFRDLDPEESCAVAATWAARTRNTRHRGPWLSGWPCLLWVKSATASEAPKENPVARPPPRRCCQQLEPRVKEGMNLSPGLSSRAAASSPEGEGFFAPGRTLGLKISIFLSCWLPIRRPCLRSV